MPERHSTDGGFDGDRASEPLGLTYEVDADEPHSEAVVRAVATLTDTSPLDLEPLYDVIDPTHLDGIFEASESGPRTEGSFEFTFGGCRVAVTYEEVRVREIDDGANG